MIIGTDRVWIYFEDEYWSCCWRNMKGEIVVCAWKGGRGGRNTKGRDRGYRIWRRAVARQRDRRVVSCYLKFN